MILYLIFPIITLYLYYIIVYKKNRIFKINSKIPGPGFGLPFLGNLYSIRKEPHLKLQEWYLKYGNIFRINMAGIETVIITEKSTLKKAFIENSNQLKKRFLFKKGNKGILFSNGRIHSILKNTVISEISNTKVKSIEKFHYKPELFKLIEIFDDFSNNGRPIQLREIMKQFTLNISLSLVFGFSYPLKKQCDGDATILVNALDNFLNFSKISVFLEYIPFLKKLNNRGNTFNNVIKLTTNLVENYIRNENENSYNDNKPIVHYFFESLEMGEITSENLVIACADLLFTGFDSSANTILYCLVELINNMEIQNKLYKEIKNENETFLNYSDYNSSFSYLKMVLLETYRLYPAAPIGGPHYLDEDIEINGFKIAKGTQVINNIYSTHRLHQVFKSPNTFKPERFENENNETDLVTFGMGQRDCIGKPIARSELLTVLATLINRYEFINPNPTIPLNNIGTFNIGTSCPDNFILIKKRI
ncbi:hypothetical protein ACTA71_001349 [Dictyostelium dimigraforme]